MAIYSGGMEETPRSVPLLHFFILAGGLIAGRSLARIRRGLRDARKPDAMSGPVENIIIIGVRVKVNKNAPAMETEMTQALATSIASMELWPLVEKSNHLKVHCAEFLDKLGVEPSEAAVDPGCAKTKSDLVVMPSGGRIFAFFCSARDHSLKIQGAFISRRVFTQAGPEEDLRST
jgi:hypothetical protein